MKKRKIIILVFLILLLVFFSISLILHSRQAPTISQNNVSLTSNDMISGDIVPTISNDLTENDNEITYTNSNTIDYSSIKAVYSSGWTAGGESSRKEMIDNINKHDFNAVVVDIKDEAGHLSYNSNVQIAMNIGSSRNMIKDINAVLEDYHQNGIYVIGRIVTFKDPTYAKIAKDISFVKSDGTYWTDKSGNYWPNPYNRECWNYPILLAKEAAELGFDEVQFDYVRFPSSEGRVKQIDFGFDSETTSKSEIINQFLTKVMDELADFKVKISADVFGITTKRDGDFENIGQDYKAIANIVDIICPMVYPSHYGRGEYHVAKPDLEPYKIIYGAMTDAQARVSGEQNTAIARPYLQDFTASWLGRGNYQIYSNEAVREQIQACYDLGIQSFTLWDPSNQYCYEAFNSFQNQSGE